MSEKELQEIVLRAVLAELAKGGEAFVPVMSSNRHVHLSREDVERLFGVGHKLTKLRDLVQPGQYACQETLVVEGAKGKATLRVVGPVRRESQVELSYTDCYKLGIAPVLRMSGEISETPGCTLVSDGRRVTLSQGVIVAKRHLHMSPEEATAYGIADGDIVALKAEGERGAVLENLVVRSGKEHRLEAHIDKDEANACGLLDGQLCRILLPKKAAMQKPFSPRPDGTVNAPGGTRGTMQPVLQTYVPNSVRPLVEEPKAKLLDLSREPHCFLGEEDVLAAHRDGYRLIRCSKGAVITPLARDTARDKGVDLIELT